ncbi:nitrogen regulation protein NR(II) [Cohnella sp. AR92]|uniref:two-component system sensor histidine kinase NtrB n=1 Tax=Cohnella sp. AR92 TaxID=648716 RepID=UPI000F8D352F|nr:ATP-binding protein [Cohnella sp. AR92]RUS44213.1 PAS domain-containing sensor histidine kinase [Cohnella sp. AR92]
MHESNSIDRSRSKNRWNLGAKEGIDESRIAERLLESILDDENTGVLLLDSGLRIKEASSVVCWILRRKRSQLLNVSLEKAAEEAGVIRLPIDGTLLDGAAFRGRSYSSGTGEKRREWLLDGTPLWEGGNVIGAHVMFRDVTQVLRLEEQIRHSDRLKMIGEVAAGTAHEIRNPLTAIKGFMQLLGKSLADREMHRELDYVKIVASELERINSLVNDILLLSKPKEVKLVATRIGSIIKEMLPMLRNEAVMRGTLLHYESWPEGPVIMADKEMLKQVLLNMGKNAIEAMGTGGVLTIRERRTEVSAMEVAVDIIDTGPGIDREHLDRIFDPFFTTKEQGTGLGLSICRRIVHEMGGTIQVSTGPEGTIFSIILPTLSRSGELGTGLGGALPFDVV